MHIQIKSQQKKSDENKEKIWTEMTNMIKKQNK